jgi:hypothetical protein
MFYTISLMTWIWTDLGLPTINNLLTNVMVRSYDWA